MRRRQMGCLALILVLCVRWNVLASDAASITLQEMAVRSTVIVTGVCLSSTSRWDESTRTIVTDSVFRVDRYVRGMGPATLLVTSPGGALPELNLMMTVSEMVEFRRGEEVVLFLTNVPGKGHSVYGMGRGKALIQRDPATGARKVRGQLLESFISEINRVLQDQRRK